MSARELGDIDADGYVIRHATDRRGRERLDEVVVFDARCVHLEQMDLGAWWLGIDLTRDERIMIDLRASRTITGSAWLDGPSVVTSSHPLDTEIKALRSRLSVLEEQRRRDRRISAGLETP